MKKLLFFLTLPISILTCRPAPQKKLTIATAANMQFAIKALTAAFTSETGIDCGTVISSSGKLTAQIQSGAPYDVFISADRKYPESLHEKNLTTVPPKIYAHGKLALWSMKDGPAPRLDNLADEDIRHIALANPKTAPYGAAAMEVLRHHGIFGAVEKKLVYGESIAQVNQFVSSGVAEVGFTALSVVLSPKMKGRGKWTEVPPGTHAPIEQGVVVLKNSARLPEAEAFAGFLFSEKGRAVLVEYGYAVPTKPWRF